MTMTEPEFYTYHSLFHLIHPDNFGFHHISGYLVYSHHFDKQIGCLCSYLLLLKENI